MFLGDIFHDVLSLYMHSKDLPMPTAEEVLYCHSTTTAEEVSNAFVILSDVIFHATV